MKRRGRVDQVAERLAAILGPEDCLLVGGLAVAAHGHVRATDDVDLVCRLAPRLVRDRLRREGVGCDMRQADPSEGEFPCVRGTLEGIPFDVFPQLVPLDWERAISLKAGKKSFLKVVDLDGLTRLKLRAGGPQDLVDVAVLVLLHPSSRGRALEMSAAHGSDGTLSRWLEDPRLKASARRGAQPRRSRRR